MITDKTELLTACRHLKSWERALELLQAELETQNPELLEAASQGYRHKISALQNDICDYLHAHPEDVSRILPPASETGEELPADIDGYAVSRSV